MLKHLSLLICALLVAAAASADVLTKKFDWAPKDGVQNVDFQWNNLSVSQISWNLGDTLKPLRVSSASAEVRIDNNGFLNQIVGIAIAVFDEQGNMIAAGSGGNKVGRLDKGERDHFRVAFPYVYRNLQNAKTFLLTVETEPQDWKAKEPKKK